MFTSPPYFILSIVFPTTDNILKLGHRISLLGRITCSDIVSDSVNYLACRSISGTIMRSLRLYAHTMRRFVRLHAWSCKVPNGYRLNLVMHVLRGKFNSVNAKTIFTDSIKMPRHTEDFRDIHSIIHLEC